MSLKTLREKLCQEQSMSSFPADVDLTITDLIRIIDRNRPVGMDGKHHPFHTPTCGCETEMTQFYFYLPRIGAVDSCTEAQAVELAPQMEGWAIFFGLTDEEWKRCQKY